jgi:hypothetical protein
LDEE